MTKLNEIKKDLESLRGKDVKIFGQPTTLAKDYGVFYVDAIDVIDELIEIFVEIDYNDLDETLEKMNASEKTSGNSYNWSGNISNDFNFTFWDTQQGLILEIKFHRFGDVRGNYTDSALIPLDDEYQFYELESLMKYSEIDGYFLQISALGETIEIESDEGFSASCYDEDSFYEVIEEHEKGLK